MVNNIKIFLIGFNKTATCSFYKFFSKNNIKSCHFYSHRYYDKNGLIPRKDMKPYCYRDKWCRTLVNHFHMNEKKHKKLLDGIDDDVIFFSDITDDYTSTDAKDFYKKLHIQNPGSKFILNIRNVDRWILSRKKHWRTGLTEKHCKYFNCNKTEIDNIWRNIFFDHVNDVIRYFKNQNTRLLIYDIEKDQPKKIVKFFKNDFELDEKHWGHHNKAH